MKHAENSALAVTTDCGEVEDMDEVGAEEGGHLTATRAW